MTNNRCNKEKVLGEIESYSLNVSNTWQVINKIE